MTTQGDFLETKTDKTGVSVYSYVSPKETWNVASHVVVTPSQTLTVDAQLSPIHSKVVKDFVMSQGKSKNELVITHAHPDHFGGFGQMSDMTSYAFPEVINSIDRDGQSLLDSARDHTPPDHVGDKAISPNRVLTDEGSFYLDDLEAIILKVNGAEADTQTVIAFPEIKVIIVQDLVYAGHTFLNRRLDNWIRTLELLTISPYYEVFLIGHGRPVPYIFVKEFIQYLRDTRELMKTESTFNGFKTKLVSKYPEYQMGGILDFVAKDLYPNDPSVPSVQ